MRKQDGRDVLEELYLALAVLESAGPRPDHEQRRHALDHLTMARLLHMGYPSLQVVGARDRATCDELEVPTDATGGPSARSLLACADGDSGLNVESPSAEPISHLRCSAGHVVGAEVLPGIQVVTASHRVIVGRLLRISCRDGCPGRWESPEVAMIARLLGQVEPSPVADQLRVLLGVGEPDLLKVARACCKD